VESAISGKTKAVLPVHFAGHPANMDAIMDIKRKYNLWVIEDAAHCLEGYYKGKKVGTIGDFTAFSFYATKNITTCEGGMLTTDMLDMADNIRILSLHGISKDAWKRYSSSGYHHWELIAPGYKYNMFDLQAAIGIHQLEKVDFFFTRRKQIYNMYESAFRESKFVTLLEHSTSVSCAYHLFVVMLNLDTLKTSRDTIIAAMQAENIGIGLHFRSLHLQPFFIHHFGYAKGMYPIAEDATERLLSLPLYPKMSDDDVIYVIDTFQKVLSYFER
jgi:dTDP-4-amino-4,6-dideoxygalactose transaminase